MPYVRAKLVWPSDPTDTPYVFDILLDAAGRVAGSWPIFGVAGGVRGDHSYPLVLGREGQLDYGAGLQSHQRFQRTNLRDRSIRVGEYVTIWSADEDEWAYRVQEVIDLAQLAGASLPAT
ncbi:hypothetical protein GAY33_10745 [Azospirillum brasilense]|uniref:hypothetical protein n=1 Tax=Azospirillum argentinense TaxID=2970906 RepID=UPI00190AB12E|nr:hypothetical protein [Azospirillum argentinense]MBK3799703.1 hypothetical protein [Azospirillum argentinense]